MRELIYKNHKFQLEEHHCGYGKYLLIKIWMNNRFSFCETKNGWADPSKKTLDRIINNKCN